MKMSTSKQLLNKSDNTISFQKNKYQIIGILNVTEDSFYDGGKYYSLDKSLEQACRLIDDGADIIDIGAESSRPFAGTVEVNLEKDKICQTIQGIRRISDIPISIDTVNALTADEAIQAGANMINDISALRHDPSMVKVIKEYQCPLVLMHMRGTPQNMQLNTDYDSLIGELQHFFEERIVYALDNGIKKQNIIIDPGIGFGKSVEGNLEILKNIDSIADNFPVWIGTSRKSFIGKILNLEVEDRLVGSLATVAYAMMGGVKNFRVHDVKETLQFISMYQAIENIK